MTFTVSLLGPPSPRKSSPRNSRAAHVEDYDSSSSAESVETARTSHSHPRPRIPFPASSSSSSPNFLLPPLGSSGRSSVSSTATSTPVPSRSVSPLPHFFSSAPSSTCTSDTESEPFSPLLGGRPRSLWRREEQRRWWMFGAGSRIRSRRKRRGGYSRIIKKGLRRLLRHPFFPRQPITIVLTLLLLTIFAIVLTLLLIHILNPDKEPLPWRAYCSVPPPSSAPPELFVSTSAPSYAVPATTGLMPPPFPPVNLDSLSPAGLLVGVFSMDSAFERRMLVRTTWASHTRSRDGAGDGDGGAGTSRTIVRFILGQPRKEWETRIKLEMEMYNDIVVLPVPENMNSGKSWAFFSWAATDGWVPPNYFNTSKPAPRHSYANITSPAPPLSPHDPLYAQREYTRFRPRPWVRPDYVVKVDDDSFVMLAELEARLRLELHTQVQDNNDSSRVPSSRHVRRDQDQFKANSSNVFLSSMHVQDPESSHEPRSSLPASHPSNDPLIYWGYLVKNRFMAGELYALSWSLVDWVSKDPTVKGLTKGAEDKQTAKWMRLHPRASEIRWTNERCWIYDHPRAGTVYSHGFLFPSEVTRVRRNIVSYPDKTPQDILTSQPTTWPAPNTPTPAAWAHSSVSTFGVTYTPPVPGLTTPQGVEALVEGSDMSLIHEGSPMTPEYAWMHREGRDKRYESKRVGGTVVVHFIKKNKWFLETALALLEGEEYSEFERHPWQDHDVELQRSKTLTKSYSKHRRS